MMGEPLVVFFSFLALGVWAMAPSVTFGDSGEFAAAAATLSLPHSPGYPLYCLLGKAFGTSLGLGNWAYRTNLLSAVCGAASLSVFSDALRRLSFSAPARLAALGCLGLSPVWLHQTGATEVFALHLLILSCLLWIICRAPEGLYGGRSLAALGLIFGLGASNHHTVVLAAPALAWQLWSIPRALFKGAAVFFVFAALGFAVYCYLPLRSLQNPPLDWGDPTNWSRFLRVLLRKDYGSFSLTTSGQASGLWLRLSQLERYGLFTAREFGECASGLALLGIAAWPRLGLKLSVGFPVLWVVITGPFFLFLGNPPFDALTTGALDRFYLASWLGLALLSAAGVALIEKMSRAAAWALCAAPLAFGFMARGQWVSRSDWAAYDYGRGILRSLPKGSSLYMDGGDDTFYSLAFLTYAHGLRPDLDLHDRGGLVFANPYGADFRSLPGALKDARRREVESPLAAAGVLFYSTLSDQLLPGYRLKPFGVLRKAQPEGGPSISPPDPWPIYPLRWNLALLARHYRDRALLALYPFMRAEALRESGDSAEALAWLRWARVVGEDALWLNPSLVYGATLMGYHAAQAKDWGLAESLYLFAAGLDARQVDVQIGLGYVFEQSGRLDLAEAAYRRALDISPDSAQAGYNLGAVYWKQSRWREASAALEKADFLKPGDPQTKELLEEARLRARTP